MTRFAVSLLRLATLAVFGAASSIACAQATIDQNKALAGNVTPDDTPGFPITISVPGHYKLMGNLNVPAGVAAGIVITASGVTLDLNGFSLVGPLKCLDVGPPAMVSCDGTSGPAGILVSGRGSRIRNGGIRGFAVYGLQMGNWNIAEQLQIEKNAGAGIYGSEAKVVDVTAELNLGHGIYLTGASLVDRGIARYNSQQGVIAGLIQNSIATSNRKAGLSGRVRGSWAVDNTGPNFAVGTISLGGNVDGNLPF